MSKTFSKDLIKSHKERLEKDKEKILHQVEELKKDHAIDNAAIDTDVREQVGHDTIQAQIKDLQRKLHDIELAFEKMAKGRYGFCEKCGVQIPVARINLIPEARFCIECEQKLYK
jgi:DnaK suppressor protein